MRKDNDPKRTAKRESCQQRRVPKGAACAVCGETDPKVLQKHHVMGRTNEETLTIWLCLTHHQQATEAQLRECVPLGAPKDFPDRLGAILRALAAFFRFLAESLDRLVADLAAWCAPQSEEE